MARDNSAQRMTACPHAQALLLDGVAGRPAVKHNGWPNGQKTVDAETLSGNCWSGYDARGCIEGGGWRRRPRQGVWRVENWRDIKDHPALQLDDQVQGFDQRILKAVVGIELGGGGAA
jgi:hypothetical protein